MHAHLRRAPVQGVAAKRTWGCRYRAPECLLTDGYYSYKMDMWGVGCVFFEVVALFPLFPGANEVDQIQKIHNVLGTPSPELLAKFTKRSAQARPALCRTRRRPCQPPPPRALHASGSGRLPRRC